MSARPQAGCRQPHGTVARYVAGCSCFDCCEAKSEYQRAYRAEGGGRLVDAAEIVQHIEKLMRSGWSTRAIAEQSALSYNTVRYVRTGRRAKLTRESAEAIMTLRIAPLATTSSALIPARHTLRLISRLRRHHSLQAIADAAGLSRKSLPTWKQRSVQARTALRIRMAAERLRSGEAAQRQGRQSSKP
jgi:lambda repressor-like predicted transcriptional regulator